MSHEHFLECRACVASTQEKDDSRCYERMTQLVGDTMVTNALAIKALVKDDSYCFDMFKGVYEFWAEFVVKHASCNAFYETCENRLNGGEGCAGMKDGRAIPVKGAPDPACSTCKGRRLIPCMACSESEGVPATKLQKQLRDLERNGAWGCCVDCYTIPDPAKCENFHRYDHKLSAEELAESIVRKFGVTQ